MIEDPRKDLENIMEILFEKAFIETIIALSKSKLESLFEELGIANPKRKDMIIANSNWYQDPEKPEILRLVFEPTGAILVEITPEDFD